MNKQLTFDDMAQAQKVNYEIINEVLKLRTVLNRLDDIKIIPDNKHLSEFYDWRADVFGCINKIIYDYKLDEYR